MTIAVPGIDLGKNSCSLDGLDASGRVVLRRRIRRETVIAFGANRQRGRYHHGGAPAAHFGPAQMSDRR